MNRTGDSSDLQSKVVSVLSGYDPSPLSKTISGHRRRVPVLVTFLGFLLVTAAVLVIWFVKESMQQLTRESLRSILAANTTCLEMWLTDVRADAERKLESEMVSDAAIQLLERHAGGEILAAANVNPSPELKSLDRLNSGAPLGWALVDLKQNVVASSHADLVGKSLRIPDDAIQRAISQQTTVCRPFRLQIPIQGKANHHSLAGGPIMCAMAPVVHDGLTVGCLAVFMDPLEKFTELLSVARSGRTGESYAFDRQGVLLSQSRFETQLRKFGLLDRNPKIVSPLNIEIRDPGADLTVGGTPVAERSRQPLTRMADQATRGGTAEDVIGYNDYRGVPVVGAWRWLPDYGIGIATEMDVAEAFRPVALLRQTFYGLAGLVFLIGMGLLSTFVAIRGLTGRVQSVSGGRRRLGQYELGDLIGRGGMGAVYLGHHPLLQRDVAIKILESDDELNQQTISRFEREVRLTAQLRHPNTIDIYDFGRADATTFYYVMEYVDGITLQELVDRCGRQSPARVIHLLLQICGSLSESHGLGMIHRDIKPSNLLLTARSGLYDMIKVLDFGLVKQIDCDSPVSESSVELTQSDGITGTPMYMSPESVRDATTADERSDLYSVGAVGYILLTGEKLFDGESSVDVCLKQLNEEPERPSDRIGQSLPEDLQNVLMSCLRKSPEERPMSADDLADSLRHCHDANGWTASEAVQWWEAGVN